MLTGRKISIASVQRITGPYLYSGARWMLRGNFLHHQTVFLLPQPAARPIFFPFRAAKAAATTAPSPPSRTAVVRFCLCLIAATFLRAEGDHKIAPMIAWLRASRAVT